MKLFAKCIVLFWVTTWFSSCYKDNEEELYPAIITCDTVSVKGYAAVVAPIIQGACYSCHGNTVAGLSGGGISLEGYANFNTYITGNKARFLGSIEHTGGYSLMPKGGNKLSDCNILKIKSWINAGQQNN